jgi:phage gp37-like protein
MTNANHADAPFRDALHELVDEAGYVTKTGNTNWHSFATYVAGYHYETLRKVLAGQRSATSQIMEATSAALGVRADYFVEYRLHLARTLLDETEIGFDAAARALKIVEEASRASKAGRPADCTPTAQPVGQLESRS